MMVYVGIRPPDMVHSWLQVYKEFVSVASKTVSSEILSTPLRQTCATTCPWPGEHGELLGKLMPYLRRHLSHVRKHMLCKVLSETWPKNLQVRSCTKKRDSGSLHLQVCTNGVI